MTTFYDSDGRVVTMTETNYDSRGNNISERISGRLVFPGSHVIYEYDTEGRLLEKIHYNPEGRQQSRESSRYNEEGDLIESARYNPDGSLTSSTEYQYVYDRRGNWIEKTVLATNNARETYEVPTEFCSRTIGYYP